MPTIHAFIISWPGRHHDAISIANQVLNKADQVSIVYSDSDPDLRLQANCNLIRRPNDLFWADKFKACLDACDSDLMLVIHSDCQCDDWGDLIQKCLSANREIPNIGVWAPMIDYTPWSPARTNIAAVNSTSLQIVAQTDGIVFCLSQPVQERMRSASYDENLYGWGIDWMFICHSFSTDKLVVVDTSILVNHPKSSGYQREIAGNQMSKFLHQLSAGELVQYQLLNAYIHVRTINSSSSN
ncbi:hypothetical protein [Herbaspirillum sp. ST 5-3]|uniref:hypothetical protein n=1 Tax=Oxalobacteraceae TaxID=75682 RepID=UPI0010A5745C|nr:hypothetical protein [Herbaspirillum sp. ST 5-3]